MKRPFALALLLALGFTPGRAIGTDTGSLKPTIIRRAAWDTEKATKPCRDYEPMIPVRISVHHTAEGHPINFEEARQEMRKIRALGGCDIGYHFVIDGSGGIWEGRPENMIGEHVELNNQGNIGIALMGNFETQEPTEQQIDSLQKLSRWLVAEYRIVPDHDHFSGHRDQKNHGKDCQANPNSCTVCPGKNLYPYVDALRAKIAVTGPALRRTDLGLGRSLVPLQTPEGWAR